MREITELTFDIKLNDFLVNKADDSFLTALVKQSYFGFKSEFPTFKQGRNWTVLYTVFQQL